MADTKVYIEIAYTKDDHLQISQKQGEGGSYSTVFDVKFTVPPLPSNWINIHALAIQYFTSLITQIGNELK
jgi:hypothetical protein